MVLLGLGLVLLFLTVAIIPQFERSFRYIGTKLPLMTQFLLGSARWVPLVLLAILLLVLAIVILWQIARLTGRDRAVVDVVMLPMPLIGPVLKRNLVARWCDAVRLGVEAGL